MIRGASLEGRKLSSTEIRYAVSICMKESGGNPAAKNKRSSAFGLYQFLTTTWKGVGIKRTLCPVCQSRAYVKYVANRYKTHKRAHKHHVSRGWY